MLPVIPFPGEAWGGGVQQFVQDATAGFSHKQPGSNKELSQKAFLRGAASGLGWAHDSYALGVLRAKHGGAQ